LPVDSVAAERLARIDATVAEVARRLEEGASVDDTAMEREQPDLMPELGERLRDLRMLMAAAERAKQSGHDDRPRDTREKLLQEEQQALREALDRYEVLDRVRYGGQGVVYRARQRGTNRLVALKVLLDGPLASERQRYRFEREAELVSRLQHPNIVAVYESGAVRGRLFFAMEFVEGQAIDDYAILHDLTPAEIVRLVVKVCRAINCAHQNGVIHRDLNPSNILVDEHGEPRVFDFGLAKDTWAEGEDILHSFTGQIIGTLPYLSPEQAGGLDGKVDVRSDIYALGVVLYELLAEVFPYPVVGEPEAIRRAIVSTEPMSLRKAIGLSDPDRAPGLGTINRDLEAILAKALAKQKDERYQSAADFADDLERYLAGEAVGARAHHLAYVLRKTLRKYRWHAAVAAVMLVTFTISSVAVTASWLHARTQRDNARKATTIAFDLFDTALTDIEESVRPLAGGVAVRDRLVQRVAAEIPEFKTVIQSDQTLDPLQTRLLEKQGDIAHQQGQRAEAAKHYRAFLEKSLTRANATPLDEEAVNAVIRAYRKLGEVAEAPIPLFEEGIELGQGALGQGSHSPATRYELCQLQHAFGELMRSSGNYERALRLYKQALDLCSQGGTGGVPDVRCTRLSAQVLSGQGLVLQKLGHGARAREAIQRALQLREQIVAQNPSDTEARHALLFSYRHLATLQRDAGQVSEAKTLFRKAADQGRLLAEMDPTATAWHHDRYLALYRLATLCLETEEIDEARACCEEAASIAERLWDLEEGSTDSLETLAYSLVLQGRLHVSDSAWTEAQGAFERAAAIRESLVESDPDNLDRLKQLAGAHYWLGSCCRKLNDAEQAIMHLERACDIRTQLVERQPDVAEIVLALISAQVNLAAAYMGLETGEADDTAADLLRKAERRLEDLHEAGRLCGLERWYTRRIEAIRANQAILRKRAEQRSGANSTQP
jgi:tetratricopeptide (TPR) repeat protein